MAVPVGGGPPLLPCAGHARERVLTGGNPIRVPAPFALARRMIWRPNGNTFLKCSANGMVKRNDSFLSKKKKKRNDSELQRADMVITNKKQINTQRKGKGKLSRSFRSVWVWAGEAMLARNIGVMCASVFRERTRSRAAPRKKT